MLRHRFAALPILAALIATALLALAGPASARPLYGVQTISVDARMTQADADSIVAQAQRLHARVVRVELLWSQFEPTASGQRDPDVLAALDRLVNTAAQHKIRTLLMVDATPCWASSAPDSLRNGCGADASPMVTRYPPADPKSYASVATFLASRYGTKLAAFEVWNEPDQANQIYWAGPDKVARYVALAKATYGPLKAVNRKLTVLAGSFVGADGRWLQALYDAGIKGSYDALSVHFYDLPLYGLRTTHKVQLKNHDRKPLWLAEFGFTSCYTRSGPAFLIDHPCLTRRGQAQNLVDTLKSIARVPWIKAGIVYTLTDVSQAYQFGLLNPAGVSKPAFTAVRNVFGGRRARVTRPHLKLRVSKGRLYATGTASQVDLLDLKARKGSLRFHAYLRTDRFGRFKLKLPAQLGLRGVSASLSAGWTGHTSARS